MPKSAVKAEPAAEPIYDVAVSFMAADETTAEAIASALEASGLKVFFFPRKQEELAGSDGLASMREPFLKVVWPSCCIVSRGAKQSGRESRKPQSRIVASILGGNLCNS
jgi:hypothetical protein